MGGESFGIYAGGQGRAFQTGGTQLADQVPHRIDDLLPPAVAERDRDPSRARAASLDQLLRRLAKIVREQMEAADDSELDVVDAVGQPIEEFHQHPVVRLELVIWPAKVLL